MILNSDFDRLGLYRVGQSVFTSKTLAQMESIKTNRPLEFDFNDRVFDLYDWTKEPEPNTSISEFYRRRAQQLRDKYEYLVLMYSGGPDSQVILDTCLGNNIHIDEIVNVNSYSKTQKIEGTTHNADFFYNAKPNIDRILARNNNKIKVTILDEIEITKKIFEDSSSQLEYYERLFNAVNFPSAWLFRGSWIKHVPHIWNKFLNGVRVGLIYGYDKPSIDVHDGKYYWSVNDAFLMDSSFTHTNDADLKGYNAIETFYQTPDMPELPIKQAHILKNFLNSTVPTKDYFEDSALYLAKDQRPPFNCRSKIHAGNLKYKYFHKVIYPSWAPNVVTPKPMFNGTRMEDCWWIYGMDASVQKIWYKGLTKHHADFKLDKKDNRVTQSGMLQMVKSKKRFLEV